MAQEDGEPTKIKLGISPFQDTMLPIIGEEKGWFDEAGLDVELTTLGWDAVMPAVASGAVDVAVNNTTGVVSVASRAPECHLLVRVEPVHRGICADGPT